MTVPMSYDASDVESVEYKIPLRKDIGVLPGQVKPVDKELLRSYFGRVARENCSTPRELLRFIQPDPPQYIHFPNHFGVFMDVGHAEQLARVLRCAPTDIYSCLLRQDHINTRYNSQHPTKFRGCAECQIEDGAWRRWNGDPVYAICPIHETLLWDEDPESGRISHQVLERGAPKPGWDQRCNATPSPYLADLQNQFVAHRKAAMGNDSEYSPIGMLYRIAWLHRRVLSLSVEQGGASEQQKRALEKASAEGREELVRIGREHKPEDTTAEHAIKMSAKDIAAVLPVALKAVNAAADGDSDYFERIYDRLFRAANGKHAPHLTRSPDEGSTTIEHRI